MIIFAVEFLGKLCVCITCDYCQNLFSGWNLSLREKLSWSSVQPFITLIWYLQVQKIRLLLRARGLGEIRVGTVDDLQGQEERIIFISTVLSKPETLPTVSSNKEEDMHVGFWRNPRRFNVATTRAKSLLVVLGHPLVLLEVWIPNQSLFPPMNIYPVLARLVLSLPKTTIFFFNLVDYAYYSVTRIWMSLLIFFFMAVTFDCDIYTQSF